MYAVPMTVMVNAVLIYNHGRPLTTLSITRLLLRHSNNSLYNINQSFLGQREKRTETKLTNTLLYPISVVVRASQLYITNTCRRTPSKATVLTKAAPPFLHCLHHINKTAFGDGVCEFKRAVATRLNSIFALLLCDISDTSECKLMHKITPSHGKVVILHAFRVCIIA